MLIIENCNNLSISNVVLLDNVAEKGLLFKDVGETNLDNFELRNNIWNGVDCWGIKTNGIGNKLLFSHLQMFNNGIE